MSEDSSYRHTQRAPLFLLSYAVGVMFLVLSWMLRQETVLQWVFPIVAVLSLILAAAFHHLTVEDSGDRLLVYFGPLPLFRRSIRYAEIVSVEPGRTTLLDGWGIHMSMRGGWVWNIWGKDCVVLQLQNGILRLGTDDVEQLSNFLNSQILDN